MTDVPTPEEIINGIRPDGRPAGHVLVGPNGQKVPLTEDQAKAISLILSGCSFVFVGIRPRMEDGIAIGAEFFTGCHGSTPDLVDAKKHLPAQIERLYRRKEII